MSSFFCSFSIILFTECLFWRSLLRVGCAVRDSPCGGSTGWGHITDLSKDAHTSQRRPLTHKGLIGPHLRVDGGSGLLCLLFNEQQLLLGLEHGLGRRMIDGHHLAFGPGLAAGATCVHGVFPFGCIPCAATPCAMQCCPVIVGHATLHVRSDSPDSGSGHTKNSLQRMLSLMGTLDTASGTAP